MMKINRILLSLLLCASLSAEGIVQTAYAEGKEMSILNGERIALSSNETWSISGNVSMENGCFAASSAGTGYITGSSSGTIKVNITDPVVKKKGVTNTSLHNGGVFIASVSSTEEGYKVIGKALADKYATIKVTYPEGMAPDSSSVTAAVYRPDCLYINDADQFDINSVNSRRDGNTVTVSAAFAETAPYKKKMDAKMPSLMKSLKLTGSTRNKIKKIHKYIISHVKYYHGDTPANSAYNAALEGRTKCAGFTELFSEMCRRAGIECLSVTGNVDEGRHAWNIVKCNGKWYWVDATWDEDYYDAYGEEDNYFMSPLKKLWDDHSLDDSYRSYYNYCVTTTAKTIKTYKAKKPASAKKTRKIIKKSTAKKKAKKKTSKKKTVRKKTTAKKKSIKKSTKKKKKKTKTKKRKNANKKKAIKKTKGRKSRSKKKTKKAKKAKKKTATKAGKNKRKK